MRSFRYGHVIALGCVLPSLIFAQPDQPTKLPKDSSDAEQSKDLKARKLYGEGALNAKQGLFLDAVKAFEECLRLDPEAVPPRRMLASLYVTVGRPEDALAMAKVVTERLPNDYEAWRQYAGLLRNLSRAKEAISAQSHAVDCAAAADRPEQLTDMLKDLSKWSRKNSDLATAERAERKLLDVLDQHREQFRNSAFLNDDDFRIEKAAACERLGETLLAENKLDESVHSFDQARTVFAESSEKRARLANYRLHWRLAQVQNARHAPGEALEHLKIYLKNVKPASVEPFELLVSLLKQVDSNSTARTLAEYVRNDPSNLPLQLLLAETYGNLGQIDDAENLYQELLKKNPKAEVYSGLFHLYERAGRADAVLQEFDEQCKVVDDDTLDKEQRKSANVHVRAMTAALLKQPSLTVDLLPRANAQRLSELNARKDPGRAFERLAQIAIQTVDPDELERFFHGPKNPNEDLFRVYNDFDLVKLYSLGHRYDETRSLCLKRIANSDRHGHVAINQFYYRRCLVEALRRLGELEAAQKAIEEAMNEAHNDDQFVQCRIERVELLFYLNKVDESLAECEQMLKDYPQQKFVKKIVYEKAMILSRSHRIAESEKLLRALLEQDPNNAMACNSLGYDLADRNRNLDEAERLIRHAIDLDRQARSGADPDSDDDDDPALENDSAIYLDSLAWVLFRKGKLAEARQWLEKATAQIDGRDEPTLWDHLGDIYYRLNEVDKARNAWQKSQKYLLLDPLTKKDGRRDEVARKLRLLN